MNIFKNQPLV